MSGEQTRRRSPVPLSALAGYAVRACVPPKRRWLLALPCAGAVAFGFLAPLAADASTADALARIASTGIFSLVLPFACLVIGDAVLGAEVRSGTLGLTWMSPVPHWAIVVGRWLGGIALAAPALAVAGVGAALAAGVPEAAAPLALALAAGATAYVALFIAIGALARRAAVWSIAVVIIVERLLGTALSGIAQLSPMWQSRAVYAGLGPSGEVIERSGIPEGTDALVRLALVTAVLLAVATWRLARLRLAGGED